MQVVLGLDAAAMVGEVADPRDELASVGAVNGRIDLERESNPAIALNSCVLHDTSPIPSEVTVPACCKL